MRGDARDASPLRRIYRELDRTYGPQRWWPADTPFEVMVGAVLTQNTAWRNVERAIANLHAAGLCTPAAILAAAPEQLAAHLRPSGYFNVKARRLSHLCQWLVDHGGEQAVGRWPTDKLRSALLAVKGIGPETADDILLYAFGRPVFVIDAYTRRLFARLGLMEADAGYEALRHTFEGALGHDAGLFNQYHALIVHHAKDICRPRPRCTDCCLAGRCPRSGAGGPLLDRPCG